jgi:predicted RNA-binding protein (virulence factor B family)
MEDNKHVSKEEHKKQKLMLNAGWYKSLSTWPQFDPKNFVWLQTDSQDSIYGDFVSNDFRKPAHVNHHKLKNQHKHAN